MVKVNLNINNKIYERTIDPEMRLVDFIRDEAKLKGTKEGCGEGECGACTVIVNGQTMNSCLLLAVSMAGKKIVTIEGIGGQELHPLQQAFMEVGASQCGYCTPGMILSAKALLDSNIQASEAEIREGISGNLCRCTGYEKIVQAVIRAQQSLQNPKENNEPLETSEEIPQERSCSRNIEMK